MKDTALPVRQAFYTLLNGNLTYDSANVTVSDGKLKGNVLVNPNNYVILSTQTSSPDYTKSSRDEVCTITLDVITKQDQSASKDAADSIADQILLLVSSSPNSHNLTPPAGFQFLELKKEADTYLPLQLSETSSIMRRLMTFSLRVTY